jgi:hypothetical protein
VPASDLDDLCSMIETEANRATLASRERSERGDASRMPIDAGHSRQRLLLLVPLRDNGNGIDAGARGPFLLSTLGIHF